MHLQQTRPLTVAITKCENLMNSAGQTDRPTGNHIWQGKRVRERLYLWCSMSSFLFSFISVHPLSSPTEGKEHKEDEKKELEIKGEENNNSMWITADLCEECMIVRLILLSAWLRLHVILRKGGGGSEWESMGKKRRERGGKMREMKSENKRSVCSPWR